MREGQAKGFPKWLILPAAIVYATLIDMKTFIIAAISADGYIARERDEMANWTSPEDKQLFVQLTKEAGIMIMGATTLKTIGRALPGRRTIVYTSHPESLTIPDIETTAKDPAALLAELEQSGAQSVAICGGASIYTMFMQAGLVDELYLSVEPVVFGAGISLFSGTIDTQLTLLDASKLNDQTMLLHYRVNHA